MIKVSLIEDHEDFRSALAALLNMSEEFELIGSYASAEAAIENIPGIEDIILLDIHLPGMSGIDAIAHLKEINPGMRIIMLTMFDDDQLIMQAILKGADGYLLKKNSPGRLFDSLHAVMSGGSAISPGIASKILKLFRQHIPLKNNPYHLTRRETEILENIVEGLTNRQIAAKLFISPETVRNHIRNIYRKLQVHSKSQAVVKALREGLV